MGLRQGAFGRPEASDPAISLNGSATGRLRPPRSDPAMSRNGSATDRSCASVSDHPHCVLECHRSAASLLRGLGQARRRGATRVPCPCYAGA
eukprot:5952509-Alexandrium_andersonii.AAC.1